MFIAALFTIAKIWQQPKCPSTDKWTKKMWYVYMYIYIPHMHIYTMEYNSAIIKKGILPFAAMWMELENIMLNEISLTEKDKYFMISFIC